MESDEVMLDAIEVFTALQDLFPAVSLLFIVMTALVVLYAIFGEPEEEYSKRKNDELFEEDDEKPKNEFKPKRDVRLMLNEDGEFMEDLPL